MTQSSFAVTGGARIGWIGASWPMARLNVSSQSLCVRSPALGSYVFGPEDVIAVESYGWLPLIGRGVKIAHSRPDYPAGIIFWCFGSPERLVQRVREAGFVPRGSGSARSAPRGIAFRWWFVAAAVIVWNGLLAIDGMPWRPDSELGLGMVLALIFMFCTALAVQWSKRVQSWALKPGRSVTEIQPVLSLIQVLIAPVLIVLAAVHFGSL